MKRALLAAMLVVLALAAVAPALELVPSTPSLDAIRDKAALTDADRKVVADWLALEVRAIVSNTDLDARGMVDAREKIIAEAGKGSPAYQQAFGEAVAKALAGGEQAATHPGARVNLMMAAAQVQRLECVALLQKMLEKDPAQAVRYWAAAGLALVADGIVAKADAVTETGVSETIGRALDAETSPMVLQALYETLGKFDSAKAHDVLTESVGKVFMRASASDPIVAQMLAGVVRSLEKAYGHEVRPEAKPRVLMAYATLCAAIMLPVAEFGLMPALNASLEKITGDKVGFSASSDPVMQKMALLEWVEKFVREGKIPKRPALPSAVEAAVEALKDAGAAEP